MLKSCFMPGLGLLLLGVVISGTGCASRRAEHFSTFARAGCDYSEMIVSLSDEAADVAIDADSHLLIKDRAQFSEQLRREVYQQRTEALRELLWTIQGLRSHSILLQRYFSALARMAETETPQAMMDETTAIVIALQNLHEQLADTRFGDQRVGDVMETAGPLTVAAFKQRVLSEELKRNAPMLGRELELQKRLLNALAGELKADLQVILEARAYTEVARPYIDDSRLPANWQRRRRDVLAGYVSMGSVDTAANAAGELQRLFRDLVEGRVRAEDWSKLFNDLNAMVGVIELAGRAKE